MSIGPKIVHISGPEPPVDWWGPVFGSQNRGFWGVGDWVAGQIEQRPTRERLNVPVGPPIDRRDVRVSKSSVLPSLVSSGNLLGKKWLLKDVVGPVIAPVKNVLPIPTIPKTSSDPVREPHWGPPIRIFEGKSTEITVKPTTNGGAMPDHWDLGNILGTIGGIIPGPDFFDLGGALLGYGGPTPGVPGVPTTPPPVTVPPPAGGGVPGYTGGGACEPDPRNNYVLKFICGQWKWVKKQKRRRKRLATSSDIGDLAKLKGILGMGKSMETWIATHG